jgi:hypothetical protein
MDPLTSIPQTDMPPHMQGMATNNNQSQSETGVDNVLYDLVSVLYHALQAASTHAQYQRDASGSNQQIAQFFNTVQQEETQRISQAKELLHSYLMNSGKQTSSTMSQGS